MKKEIEFSEAIGRTIEGRAFSITSGQAVITFTDGSFTTLCIAAGWSPGCETIGEDSLHLNSFGDSQLDDLGIITFKEIREIREKRTKHLKDNHEREEKKHYEILRKKYGSNIEKQLTDNSEQEG